MKVARRLLVPPLKSVVILSVFLLGVACSGSGDAVAPTEPPSTMATSEATFEEGPCPDTTPRVPALEDARCGVLIVPENRANPNGRTVRLAVATIPAVSSDPSADPIVYMAGGPGVDPISQETTMLVDTGINADRDLILMGQRGTLNSEPALLCPEIDVFNARSVGLVYDAASTGEEHVAATQACRDRLSSQGIDLAAYNTTENAADFADLRRALEIDEWNIYGTSYGTDLALTYMRQYPEGLRSVVVDSVFPPDIASLAATWGSVKEAGDNIFRACEQQPACAKRYPDLEDTFTKLVRKLEAEPLTTTYAASPEAESTKVVIDGGALIQWFVGIGALPAGIPSAIDDLASGDPEQVAMVRAAAADPSRMGTDGTGLFYGAFCSEWIPYQPQSEVLVAGKRDFPSYPDSVLVQPPQLAFMTEDCEVWEVPKAPAEQRAATPSDIPTLIISGTFDARTSPGLGEHAAESLPNSTVVNIPGVGHVVVPKSPCAQEIFAAFLADPDAPPDTGCVESLKPEPFTVD